METSLPGTHYPRDLTAREREWILWILPADRPGYREYRTVIDRMSVIGEGRRGNGEIILGPKGSDVNLDLPLAPVFAYGAIDTNFGTISVTLREISCDQISVESVCQRMENVPEEFEESRRWTYSTWMPGQLCPQCNEKVREVQMQTAERRQLQYVLSICSNDKRLWVYDAILQVNKLIPVTNYYNELMLHKNIRDPKIALDAKRFFFDLNNYSDEDLVHAFVRYNALKSKVVIGEPLRPTDATQYPITFALRKIFSRYPK